MLNDKYYNRRYVITIVVTMIVMVYIGKLFSLQILDETTKNKAESNALLKQTISPSRGLIYDRNGKLLVLNQPIYEVSMIIQEMGKTFDTLGFCNALSIDTATFRQRMQEIQNRKKNRGYSRYTPQTFLSQLSKEEITPLQETLYKFPGIDIRKQTRRDYTYNAAAQILGSVGEVTQQEIDKNAYYATGDYTGKSGIERTYEVQLRGEKGVEIWMRDSRGRIQGKYKDGEMDEPAKQGKDITLTIDIELQKVAEELLNGKIGSVVAIAPKTGEVLAMASSPTWNPSLLVGRARSKNYQALLHDPTKPLLNRATQAQYSPGSTFKTVQALIALQEGAINSQTRYICNGRSSQPIRCTHSHGTQIDVINALEQSCNPYFYCAFRDLLEQGGYGEKNEHFKENYNRWRDYVMSFGFGQRFADSDISEQSSGNIPTTAFYDRYYGKKSWRALTIRSLSIGQGEILVTPLQLANMTAAIANEGYYVSPHLCKTDSLLEHRHTIDIDKKHFQLVKQGMQQVMEEGSSKWYKIEGIEIGGKTGTTQNGKDNKDHALFVGMAPMDAPEIVVAVIVENAGFGATWAAPIGSMIIEQYLKGKIERTYLYDHIAKTIINPDVKKR